MSQGERGKEGDRENVRERRIQSPDSSVDDMPRLKDTLQFYCQQKMFQLMFNSMPIDNFKVQALPHSKHAISLSHTNWLTL